MTRVARLTKRAPWLAAAFALTAVAAGCAGGGSSGGSTGQSSSGPIKFASLGALTGAYAVAGKPELDGTKLAVANINAAGGVCGRKLQLAATLDDQGQANLSVAGLHKIVNQDGVKLVLGPGITPPALATSPLANTLKTWFMVQTAQRQTWQGRKYVFSDVTPQDVEGRLMFQYLSHKLGAGAHSVGIIYAAVPYAQAGYEQLKSLAQAKGDKVVDQDNYDAGGLSFTSQAQRLAARNPDGVMLWGAAAPADAQILAQIRAAGYKGPIVGDVSFSLPFVPGIAKRAASTIVTFSQLNLVDPQGATKRFLQQYKAQYKSQATYLPAAAYDAVHVLAAAIKRDGCKTDPTSVANAMVGLTYTGVNGTYNYTSAYKGGPPASSFKPITYKRGAEVFAPSAG